VGRLQSEVEGLRRNQAEVTKLETEIAAAGLRRSHCALLLKTLSQALPRQVVMTSIRADQTGFTLSGGVSTAGLSGDDWRRWIDQFRTPALPWKLVAAEHAMPTADFSIKGVWL
jgi:Tfp pilus assembly protein PilN